MNPIKSLRAIFCAYLMAAGIYVLIFEAGFLEVGLLAGDDVLDYWLGIIGVALTIVLLPTALRLMKFQRVKQEIEKSEMNYLRWSIKRLVMLSLPLHYNILCYYFLGCEPTFVYMALMCAVAHIFVWPTRGRMEYERELTYSQNEQ